ncbi:MAG TPA: hypothetical protein VJS92_08905 [Candidatus Polarisedimenticolaceae bacterium]|nr:hypothetical protein [Candidatus Polarisedimenticolaceae bacterium]
MQHVSSTLVGLLLAGALAAGVARAQVCPRPDGRQCQPTLDNCANVDLTATTVQLGGEGSVGTEDECQSSPAKDAEGHIVEADLSFSWDRASSTAGTLTLVAQNVTCAPSISKINTIWFNAPTAIAGCVLKTAVLTNPGESPLNVCGDSSCTTLASGNKTWTLSSDANGEGCLGSFDWQLGTQGVLRGVLPGGSLALTLDCVGSGLDALTACDIATDGSEGEVGDRLAQAALHFLNTDPTDGQRSNKVSSNCQEELVVELAGFEATPGDSAITLEWSTALERNNAGFRLTRRELVSGRIVTVGPPLIPAEGDLYAGASYRLVDRSAINGVQYEYVLVDVELDGGESRHPGRLAVANPPRPPIRLLAPSYGSAHLRLGSRPSFAWEAGARGPMRLVVSTDPEFSDGTGTLVFVVPDSGRRSGSLTLNAAQSARMERLATGNAGALYWRVEQPFGSSPERSATFALTYGVLDTPRVQRLRR